MTDTALGAFSLLPADLFTQNLCLSWARSKVCLLLRFCVMMLPFHPPSQVKRGSSIFTIVAIPFLKRRPTS